MHCSIICCRICHRSKTRRTLPQRKRSEGHVTYLRGARTSPTILTHTL
jgi:hypothetical protein